MARRVRRRASRPRRSAPSRARPGRAPGQLVPPAAWKARFRARWPQLFQLDAVLEKLQRAHGVDPDAVRALLFPNEGQSPFMRMAEECEAADLGALLAAVALVRARCDPAGPVAEMLDARIKEWTD